MTVSAHKGKNENRMMSSIVVIVEVRAFDIRLLAEDELVSAEG